MVCPALAGACKRGARLGPLNRHKEFFMHHHPQPPLSADAEPSAPAPDAAQAAQLETQSLLLARVDRAYLRPAHCVPASTSMVEVARVFKTQRTTSVLVEGMGSQAGVAGMAPV